MEVANNWEVYEECLEAVQDVLNIFECVKCGAIPKNEGDKVYTLGNCFHKYCFSCVGSVSGKPCGSCPKVSKAGITSTSEDNFSSSAISRLMKLKAAMLKSHSGAAPAIAKAEAPIAYAPTPLFARRGLKIKPQPTVDVENEPNPNVKTARQGRGRLSPDIMDVVTSDVVTSAVASAVTSAVDTLHYDNFKSKSTKSVKVEDIPKLENNSDDSPPVVTTKRGRNGKGKSVDLKPSAAKRGRTSPDIMDIVSTSVVAATKELKFTPKSIKSEDTPRSVSPTSRKLGRTSSGSVASGCDSPVSLGSTSFTSNSGKVDKKNAKGETALHIACRTGQLEKATQVLCAGADPNAQVYSMIARSTPLTLCNKSKTSLAQKFDYGGWTPLHEAINGKGSPSCKLDLVKLLCEDGSCNPNIPGMGLETAVHEAARGNLRDIIVYLLDHGASPNIRNSAGKLPRDVAASNEIANILGNAIAEARSSDSHDASLLDDPVVLEIQVSNAVVYFNYDVSPDVLSKVEQILKLKVSKDLKGARPAVTHMVFPSEGSGTEEKVVLSFEYLHGIATGAWMLNEKWIEESLAAKRVLSPCAFEIQGCDELDTESHPPRCARLNKELGNVRLFHGICFYFYKNSSYENIGKKNLSILVNLADGQVINREPNPSLIDPLDNPIRFHAKQDSHKLAFTSHIILYDDKNKPPTSKMHNMEHVKVLQTRWLIESLGTFQLKDPDNYL